MWAEFGEALLMSMELLGGVFLLWFLWSISSDICLCSSKASGLEIRRDQPRPGC